MNTRPLTRNRIIAAAVITGAVALAVPAYASTQHEDQTAPATARATAAAWAKLTSRTPPARTPPGGQDSMKDSTNEANTTTTTSSSSASWSGKWSHKARRFQVALTGEQEVDTVGAAGGKATALLRLDPITGRVAFKKLAVTNVLRNNDDAVTKLHIHRGARGVNGDVVIDFSDTLTGGADRGSVKADPALVSEIVKNPGGFYLNLHTTSFPKGAVRGQIEGCMIRW